jgi:hypothetical protein
MVGFPTTPDTVKQTCGKLYEAAVDQNFRSFNYLLAAEGVDELMKGAVEKAVDQPQAAAVAPAQVVAAPAPVAPVATVATVATVAPVAPVAPVATETESVQEPRTVGGGRRRRLRLSR